MAFLLNENHQKDFAGGNIFDFFFLTEAKLAKMILAHLSSLSLRVDSVLTHSDTSNGTASVSFRCLSFFILFPLGFDINKETKKLQIIYKLIIIRKYRCRYFCTVAWIHYTHFYPLMLLDSFHVSVTTRASNTESCFDICFNKQGN